MVNITYYGIVCIFLSQLLRSLLFPLGLLLHDLAEFSHGRLGAVVDDVLYLEFVLVVGVMLRQVTELLGQMKAVLGQLGTDKILRYLDTVVQISHLK